MSTIDMEPGERADTGNKAKRWLVSATAGAVVGAGSVFLADMMLGAGWDDVLKAAGPTGVAGTAIGLGLAALGAYLTILTFLPERLMRRAAASQPDDDLSRMRPLLRIAGVGALAYAFIIGLFLIPGIPPALGLGAGTVAFALVSWLFWLGTQRSDELERAAQGEAISWSFLIVEAALIGWALGHHFGFFGPLDPLGAVLFVTSVYYAAAVYAAVRRGMTD